MDEQRGRETPRVDIYVYHPMYVLLILDFPHLPYSLFNMRYRLLIFYLVPALVGCVFGGPVDTAASPGATSTAKTTPEVGPVPTSAALLPISKRSS